MADQIGVMSHGKLVEFGDVEEIFEQPKEKETKELIKAVPTSWGWRE
jgi:ABC-type oligopeptide transport system ATPase subunit